jgi:Carboxypeptidase regulatory-like domain
LSGTPGDHSYVAGAKLIAIGPVVIETETSADGKYAFVLMPPGKYTVEASFAGLEAAQTMTIEANQVVQVPLQLRPFEVKTSVTVTASEADAKVPAPSQTITDKTLRDAPNLNERFDTLLPLVPELYAALTDAST